MIPISLQHVIVFFSWNTLSFIFCIALSRISILDSYLGVSFTLRILLILIPALVIQGLANYLILRELFAELQAKAISMALKLTARTMALVFFIVVFADYIAIK